MSMQKILVTDYKGIETAFLFKEDRLMQIFFKDISPFQIGDVYIGRVKNIVSGLKAAFVELSPDAQGFLPIEHLKYKNILHRDDVTQLKSGDEIIVQISKEAHKSKDVTLTTDISFYGSYLVLIPFSQGISYSKKLSKVQKAVLEEKLVTAVKELLGDTDVFMQHYGVIVRTNAVNASSAEIMKELHMLFHKASHVVTYADKRTVFSCLYKEDSFYEKLLYTFVQSQTTEIISDKETVIKEFSKKDYLSYTKNISVRHYTDPMITLYKLYGLEEKVTEALQKKVWLKQGGYLVIEPTEALTVIDVNSGKSSSNRNKLSADDFLHKTNIDAASEIMRQIRLRNISGIIIIDFLKTSKGYTDELLVLMKDYAKSDPIETVIVGMTALGLMEITRKKTEVSLKEKLDAVMIAKGE